MDITALADPIDDPELRWLCDYPEFNDPNCMVYHRPAETWQPRKHTGCGFHWVIPATQVSET